MRTCLLFREWRVFDEMKSQISSVDEIHDEVKILSVLEGIECVDQKFILQAF